MLLETWYTARATIISTLSMKSVNGKSRFQIKFWLNFRLWGKDASVIAKSFNVLSHILIKKIHLIAKNWMLLILSLQHLFHGMQ